MSVQVRRLCAALAAGGLSAALAPTAAPAAAAEVSFSGVCGLMNAMTFSPPILSLPRDVDVGFITLTGTCEGTLDGQVIERAPAKLEGGLDGSVGCALIDAAGTVHLRFTRGTAVTFDDTVVPIAVRAQGPMDISAITFTGLSSGHGRGSISASPGAHHDEKCAQDEPARGVGEMDAHINLQTVTEIRSLAAAPGQLEIALRVPRRQRLRDIARRGVRATIVTNGPVAAAFALSIGGRRAATRELQLSGALGERRRVRLRLHPRGLRLLRRARTPRLRVVVVATHAAEHRARATASVRVIR